MSRAEGKTSLEILIPSIGFQKLMHFNHFHVTKEEGFTLVQISLQTKSGIISSYAFTVSDFALEQNKNSLLDYLSRLRPSDKELSTAWRQPPIVGDVDFVDVIHMAYRGPLAEISLFIFSYTTVTRLGRPDVREEDREVPAQAVAVLRCEPELQRMLIADLYEAK